MGFITEGAYNRGGLYPWGLITEGAYTRGTYNQGGLHSWGLITEGAYIRGDIQPRGFISEGAYIRGTYNRGGLYPRGLIIEGLITEEAYNWNIKKLFTTRYISADQIRLAFTGSINKSNSFQYIKIKVRGELTSGGAYNKIYCFVNGYMGLYLGV